MRWIALCLLLAAPSFARAESVLEKAKALVEKKDCDQLLLSFENAKPGADAAADLALARVLAGAAAGPCASDKIVAFSVAGAAARLAPKDVEVLVAAGQAGKAAGQNGEAEGFLDKAVKAAPADPRPRLARAELALAEQEPQAAMTVLAPVKGKDARAQALYQEAQKAAKQSDAEKEKLRKAEEQSMNAAAQAMKEDRPSGSGKASPKGRGASDDGLSSGPSSGKPVFATTGVSMTASKQTFSVHLKPGRTYRVQASGYCFDTNRSGRLAGGGHEQVSADLRFKLGHFEHGLSTTYLQTRSDDFDFVAESATSTLELWNASFTSGDAACSLTLVTISER